MAVMRSCAHAQYESLGRDVNAVIHRTKDIVNIVSSVSLCFLVHGQVTIIFVVSVCLSVCLFVQSFSQPSLIRFDQTRT